MIEIDARIQASVTGADAGMLDAWYVANHRRYQTLDALASWFQQFGFWSHGN